MSKAAKDNIILTDEMIEKFAQEWENDTWSGHLDKVVMGRPRISEEDLVNITFRIPRSRLTSIEKIAKENGETRSEFLRNAVDRALVAANR